jgi:hypothetical protein
MVGDGRIPAFKRDDESRMPDGRSPRPRAIIQSLPRRNVFDRLLVKNRASLIKVEVRSGVQLLKR